MPPKSNVPIRICGSKTRSGCRTCKARHIKCDESKPACLKCQKKNRQCVYDSSRPQTPQQAFFPDQASGLDLSVVSRSRNYLDYQFLDSINPYGPHEVAEVTAVKHFATNIGEELAGCFSDNVWCDILPRVAQHERSIWHATVAVGMLDTNIRLRHHQHGDEPDVTLAIRHYNKAIQELNTRLGSIGNTSCKDVVLLCCLLFAIFECLQDHLAQALRHISGGTKLLMEWTNDAQSSNENIAGAYLDRRTLQPMFLCLDSQAVQMGVIGFRDFASLPAVHDQINIPVSFATAEEAHLVLNQIFNRLSRWAHWIEPTTAIGKKPDDTWMMLEKQALQTLLTKWDAAFESPSELSHTHPPTLLLLVQRDIIQVCYNKANGPTELEFDKSLPLFQRATENAEAYMELTTANEAKFDPYRQLSWKPRPVFTVAMDIVMALYLISAKCRDSKVRRRALAMLKSCGRKEGIWDSYLCAGIAEKIIEIEESGALADGFIPESARIYQLDVRLNEESRADIKHKRHVSSEDGGHSIETSEDFLSE